MAGAYCRYCDRRCFVFRQVIVGGEVVWQGHLATCQDGMEHDRRSIGMDSATAHNPIWDGCSCSCMCGPKTEKER